MLGEYEKDRQTGMDISKISREIYYYTNGYPFKNIEQYTELKHVVKQILLNGMEIPFVLSNGAIELGYMFGILAWRLLSGKRNQTVDRVYGESKCRQRISA